MKPAKHLFLVIALSLTAAVAQAASEWSQLSDTERSVLEPFAGQWSALDEAYRDRLRKGAARWSSMTRRQRAEAVRQFERWQALSPEEQARIREQYGAFRALPAEEQRKLRARQRWFHGLPADRQNALRERWREASSAEQYRMQRQELERRRQNEAGRFPGEFGRHDRVAPGMHGRSAGPGSQQGGPPGHR